MRKVVLSLSGGMDSSVLLFRAIHHYDEVHAITFDYGQRHKIELEYLNKIMEDAYALAKEKGCKIFHKVLDVRFLREIAPTSSLTNDDIATPDVASTRGEAQPLSYVPFRNQLFLSICCSYAEGHTVEEVWYGAAKADTLAGYWDGSKEFLEQINNTISLNRMNTIRISAPLIAMDKKDIVLEGLKYGVDFSKCWTCYSGEFPADATSTSSSLRLKGFLDAGYQDPMTYKQDLTEIYRKYNATPIEYNK